MPLFARRLLITLLCVASLATTSCAPESETSYHRVGVAEPLDVNVFVDQVEAARQSRAQSRGVAALGAPDDLAFVDDVVDADSPSTPAVDDGDGLFGEEAGQIDASEDGPRDPDAEAPTDGAQASDETLADRAAQADYASQPTS